MKVIINGDYGGFGLSDKVYEYLIKEKGWKCKKESEIKEDDIDIILDDIDKNKLGFSKYSFAKLDRWGDSKKIRTYLDIIEAVEKLGEEANDRCASLKIIEIPDSVDWQVEEYDGNEWISEVHRTWH